MSISDEMVSVDSNCLTFLVESLEGIEKPTDALAEQKIALARCFYFGVPLLTTETVRREAEDIRDPVRREKHLSWMRTHFGTVPLQASPGQISQRAKHLHQFHPKVKDWKDCAALSEAEAAQFAILLSYDDRFVRQLSGKSNVRLVKPVPFWISLNIPKGTPPKWKPDHVNPLVTQSWWYW
jgi:hypothetical protein